jgi:hypothetical protein
MARNRSVPGSTRPAVFISYSHDSPEHKANVLTLAKRLRAEGVACELDQFHDSPPQGWPRWTMDQIEGAAYVLVVCSKTYNQRFRGKAKTGKGKGAKWEGAVITQELYDDEARNAVFLPVVLTSANEEHIPLPLRGATHYDLSQPDGFIDLLRRVTSQPKVVAPPVAKEVRTIPNEVAELEARKFDKEVGTDAAYYTAKLGAWPVESFNGEDVLPKLEATLNAVEANVDYREKYRNIWATLYRMMGGAYLIHSKMELPEKILSALPYLRRSRELWPDQQRFPENIAFMENFLRNKGGDIKEYLTNVLQILRGPGDAQIPTLVERMAGVATGPERKAQSWLLHEATPNPIWNFLQAVQLMIKKERNIDTEIDVKTKLLPDGHVEVQATIGPNVFLWDVNLEQKTFVTKNELTEGFMGLIANAKGQ